VGGHDRSLNVCDDHDLVVRTYLAGAKFHHIPETLYLYRMHADGGNSFLLRNQEIQEVNEWMAIKYTHPIVAEWCRRNELPMYDLGGAHGAVPGFKTVDIQGDADVIHDVRTGLPWGDSSVGCIRAYDFLEHIPHCGSSTCKHDNGCTVQLMNEIHRVLVPGGMLLSATPSTDGRGAWQDPTHVSGWNTNSFWYYTRAQQQKYVPGITARFQGTKISNHFPSEWHKQHNIVYAFAELTALKGQRQAGICEI
jgi:predicted SAM-dependent methyltransferase